MARLQTRTTPRRVRLATFSIRRPFGRLFRLLMVPVLTFPQQGCAFMMPGFDYGFGYFTQKVPLVDVENQIQCVIRDFITSHTISETDDLSAQSTENTFSFSQLLDPDQPAQVTVTLVTDLNGKVTFTGIDLSKF